jgi:hypothetical protein
MATNENDSVRASDSESTVTDPFDDPNGDVILRSRDNVDFRTFKLILSLASDVFNGMFSLPLPSTADSDQVFKDGLPVIPMGEESSSLRRLLLFCHPGKAPEVGGLPEVQRVAMKYEMGEVARRVLEQRVFRECHHIAPIMLDTIKQQTVGNDSLYLAALYAVLFPTDPQDVVVLGLSTQSQFNAFLRYRKECGTAADRIASPQHNHYKWFSKAWDEKNWFDDDLDHTNGCGLGGNIYIGNLDGKWMTRRWWRDYIYAVCDELQKRPSGAVATSGKLFDEALQKGSNCRTCQLGLESDLREFAVIFGGEIDKAVKAASSHVECPEHETTY